MTMQYSATLPDYDRRLKDFMQSLEGEYFAPYVDYTGKDSNGQLKLGNPTIGWGFALNDPHVKTKTLDTLIKMVLGIDDGRSGLSSNAAIREAYYYNELKKVLNRSYLSDPTSNHTGLSTQQLQVDLDALMLQREQEIIGANSGYYVASDKVLIGSPKRHFEFTSQLEVEQVFDSIKKSFEDTLNGLLPNIPNSNERVALFSMAYQGTLTGTMKNALVSAFNLPNSKDAHAEAWYAIRYLRGKEAWRCYMESAMFGLYEDSGHVGVDDARAVYQMLSRYQMRIESYDTRNSGDILNANQKIKNAGMESIYHVETLVEALNSARDAIFADLQAKYPEALSGFSNTDFLSTDIQYGDAGDNYLDGRTYTETQQEKSVNNILIGDGGKDTLKGGAGDDVLDGGTGDDLLDGGTGDDILIGGEGDDTYIWNAGDHDRIIDSDSKGKILFKGKDGTITEIALAGAFLKAQQSGNAYNYTLPDGSIAILSHNSPWKITMPDGSTRRAQ